MDAFFSKLLELATSVGIKLLLALIVLIVGRILIKSLMKLLKKSVFFRKTEGTVKSFLLSFIKIFLYVLLTISIIGIFGVPMASVITVLASAGVAVGLALQGALSNLAGGIMIMIFKPFKLGDFVETAGVSGKIKEVTLFYTVFVTLDNKRVTVPNGSLMNANITDFSSEELRRVDLTFTCAKTEAPAKVQEILLQTIRENKMVLSSPEPFARIEGGGNEATAFSVKVWCKNENYWDVYYDLTQSVTEAFLANHIKIPAVHISRDA